MRTPPKGMEDSPDPGESSIFQKPATFQTNLVGLTLSGAARMEPPETKKRQGRQAPGEVLVSLFLLGHFLLGGVLLRRLLRGLLGLLGDFLLCCFLLGHYFSPSS